ncbi:MAG: sigma-70 family RNA polymerase sigma factor [Lentisphaerae bacterium]|nr:sigma-70 family RNA polymerase sigma factor [Lentisphaerota bacterium]
MVYVIFHHKEIRHMPIKYPTTSKTLLEKISSGDEISWDEFYRKYAPVIKAVARYKGIEYDADDICQQVMMHFFKQSKTFKFDPGLAKFRTYLGRIVSWKIIDYYRKKREKLSGELNAVPVDAELDKIYMAEWRKVILAEAEDELRKRVNPETFQAYQLYAVQGRPVEKVAAFLECSTNQVYQAKKRCFAMMREILLKMNEADPDLQMELARYDI